MSASGQDPHQTRAHARTTSGSFRIAIDHTSNAPSPRPPPSPKYNRSNSSPYLGSISNGSGRFGSSSEKGVGPSGMPSPSITRMFRSSRNSSRWPTVFMTLVGLWAFYLLLSSVFWSSRTSGLAFADELPTVERSALEKLRLLEIHFGRDEDQDDDAAAYDALLQGGKNRDSQQPANQADRVGGAATAADEALLNRPTNDDYLPVVAEMPDTPKILPNAMPPLSKMLAEDLDDLMCPNRPPGQPCAFLLPAWLGEQETKAQLHLYQLGLLALSLNRTLVLPNVAKSRLSTCYANPFSFYYAEDALETLGVPTVPYADFLEWAERRDPSPSAQIVSMVGVKPNYLQGAIEIDSASDPSLVPNKPSRNLCLKPPRSRLDFSSHSPLAIYPPEGYHRTEAGRLGFGESVVNTLRSVDVGRKSSRSSSTSRSAYALPHVLAFNYELRFPIMAPSVVTQFVPALAEDPPLPFAHFQYSDMWTDLASSIADQLSPFIAIHWRTETLPAGNLVSCASSLVAKLAKLHATYPTVKNIYIATDYPIESLMPSATPVDPNQAPIAHSGTFAKVVTPQHHTAFKTFLKEFQSKLTPLGLQLTTFEKQQALLSLPESLVAALAESTTSGSLAELDAGLVGIVDKAVAMRSEVFLTGASTGPAACAKISSFTAQIVQAREGEIAVQGEGGEVDTMGGRVKGELWNAASHWSVGGKGMDD